MKYLKIFSAAAGELLCGVDCLIFFQDMVYYIDHTISLNKKEVINETFQLVQPDPAGVA